MTDDEYTPTTEDVAQAYMNGVWDGGTGETGPRVEATFNRWLAEHDAEVAAIIVDRVRRNCTPSSEAYAAGGYAVILAVADWIENPPDWVDAPWAGRGK